MAFSRRDGALHCDGVPLARIADAVGTPAYVYSWSDIAGRFAALEAALDGMAHRICYAVKANSNLSILARLAGLGAGFDIVSGGELERVLRAGGQAADAVFSGVGKSTADIDFAIKCGIGSFNVESAAELERIAARAGIIGRRAAISVRVNPHVDADTHPYIATGLRENKFGVPVETARRMYRRAAEAPLLDVVGVDCHIGSQIGAVGPFEESLATLLDLVDALAAEGIALRHIDVGGGFGIRYRDEAPLDLAALCAIYRRALAKRALTLVVEPGRCLVAHAGALLTRVEYLKPAAAEGARSFAVVDAAMNDLLRPALYDAWHPVEPVADSPAARGCWDIVGPVCESGDFLALERELAIAEGDLLAIRAAGAYGFSQSSNYNTRPRAPEVLVDGDDFAVVRSRESVSELLRLESIIP